MYEKLKRSDEDFIAIGSVADEKLIKRMNKKDSSKGEEIKQESKEEVKKEENEEGTRKRKLEQIFLSKNGKTECLGTKPQPDQAEPIEDINLNVVTRSNDKKNTLGFEFKTRSKQDEFWNSQHKWNEMQVGSCTFQRGAYELLSPQANRHGELSIPEQMATGKGTSNPLMAGSLPKTTKPT
ncbi:hypothetical protein Tco_0302631 [Tanacetum coccineum]